jgi:hypothetical protein
MSVKPEKKEIIIIYYLNILPLNPYPAKVENMAKF